MTTRPADDNSTPITGVHRDPVALAEQHGRMYIEVLTQLGMCEHLRHDLLYSAIDHVREIMAVIEVWQEEFEEAEAELDSLQLVDGAD